MLFLLSLQEEEPFPGPESGLTRADKATDLIGKGTQEDSSRVRKPRGLLCHVTCSLRFYGDGVGFQVASGQAFWLRVHFMYFVQLPNYQ